MSNKQIKFISANTAIDISKPEASSRSVPVWYRKMKGVKEKIETVKKCIPFLDALTSGYTITLPVDVVWNSKTREFTTQSKIEVVSRHHPVQTDMVDLPPEFDTDPQKWINNWFIKTPRGYSCLFVHPLNRTDLPFYSFTGIVDTDKHPLVVNFPFVMRKDFDGVIPAGTPLIQIIPFKREKWTSKIVDTGESYRYPYDYEVDQAPFAWYKRKWWTKKSYS